MIVDLSIDRQRRVPVDVCNRLEMNNYLSTSTDQLDGMIIHLSIFDLSSREKSIDGKSLVGKIAVAEARDPVPVRASVTEQLREAGWKECELGLRYFCSWPLDPLPPLPGKMAQDVEALHFTEPFSSPI